MSERIVGLPMIYAREATETQIGTAGAIQSAAAALAGDKLIVDSLFSVPDAPPLGEHWFVERAYMIGEAPAGGPLLFSPRPLIYICPAGTRSPALGVANASMADIETLIPVPTDSNGAFNYAGQYGQPLLAAETSAPFVVPANCFIRAIFENSSGAATVPAGAKLTLNWLYQRRKNTPCPQEVLAC